MVKLLRRGCNGALFGAKIAPRTLKNGGNVRAYYKLVANMLGLFVASCAISWILLDLQILNGKLVSRLVTITWTTPLPSIKSS
jgi:hypothetical protein